jgi:maleylacetate reductase
MKPFVHDVPASRVVFGVGRRTDVAAELIRLGWTRPLLVGSGSSAAGSEIEGLLSAMVVGRFEDVVMHVPSEVAQSAIDLAVATAADSIVAVGGGSAIGTAKAVARRTRLPILAIPTTYAGSEMTSIWGETADRRKVTGRDPQVLPRVVIYDPELSVSLPPGLSAASGMNALAHLVEGMYAPEVSPLMVATAREGVGALALGLPRVVTHPHDLEARAQVTYGSWLAGWVLGSTAMGLHHKICHTLGGAFDLPHAACHSVVLPYVVAANSAAAPAAMEALENGLRDAGRSVDHAAGAVWDLRDEIEAPSRLAELGLQESAIDQVVGTVVDSAPTNPRVVDEECVRAVLIAAFSGLRPGASL